MRDNGLDNGRPAPGTRNLPAPAENRTLPAQAGGYGYGAGVYPGTEQPDDEIDLIALARRLFAIALKWRYLIMGIAGAFLAIGLAYSFLATPLYSATVRIQIDREAGKVIEGGLLSPSEQGGTEFQRTQNELLKSRGIAERTVSTLSLDGNADFTEQSKGFIGTLLGFFSAAPTPEELAAEQEKARQRAVGRVQSDVSIHPLSNSRLVDIVYTDPSPTRAAVIANAYADSFVTSSLDKRFEANAYAKVFLEDQLKQLKLRLEDSERAMIAFAERENMVQTNDQVSIAESNLAAANAALGTLISNRIRDEEMWRQVESSDAINLPQLLTNNVIDGLRTQRNQLRREYEEKAETFKPGYPEMVQISNKIAEIDRQLATEVKTIRNSLRASYESSAGQEEQMRKRIAELRAEVIELQKKSVQYGILKREVDSNRSLYNDLLQRYKEVDVASGVGTNNIFIVDRALPPGSPSYPRKALVLAGALMLGLMVGFGTATLIELFDTRIRTPDDAEKTSGLPLLGIVPKADMSDGILTELGNPRSGIAESYRTLATSLQFATENGLPRSLVISSSGPGEGKSTTAIALARHFAVTGKKVLLVDADMRKPSLHTKLGFMNEAGLSNVLTGMHTISQVLQTMPVDNLSFIPSGPLPPNAAELLGGTQLFSFLSVALEMFDLVIFDSPPLLGIADAQLLGAAAAATIFVIGSGDARRGPVQNALKRLHIARALPIGCVLTKFDARTSAYGYGYGYGYDYNYGQDTESKIASINWDKLHLPRLKRKPTDTPPSEVN